MVRNFVKLFTHLDSRENLINTLSDENDRLVEKNSKDDETIKILQLHLDELAKLATEKSADEEIVKEINLIRELLLKQEIQEIDLIARQ